MNKTFSVALIAMSAHATEFFGGNHDPLANDWNFHDDPLTQSVNQSVYSTFNDVLGDFDSHHDDDFGFHSLGQAQNAV